MQIDISSTKNDKILPSWSCYIPVHIYIGMLKVIKNSSISLERQKINFPSPSHLHSLEETPSTTQNALLNPPSPAHFSSRGSSSHPRPSIWTQGLCPAQIQCPRARRGHCAAAAGPQFYNCCERLDGFRASSWDSAEGEVLGSVQASCKLSLLIFVCCLLNLCMMLIQECSNRMYISSYLHFIHRSCQGSMPHDWYWSMIFFYNSRTTIPPLM